MTQTTRIAGRSWPRAVATIALLSFLPIGLACSGGCSKEPGAGAGAGAGADAGAGGAKPETPQAPPPKARPASEIDAATAGRIHGVVRFAGTPPKPEPVALNAECSHVASEPVVIESLLVSPDGALQNVLVHVKSGLEAWEFPVPSEPAVLDQKGCRYVPHGLVMRAGQTLQIHTSDPVVHNVNLSSRKNGLTNKAQLPGDKAIEFKMKRPENGVNVRCDIHPWMGALVHVLEHPKHALTGADGRFTLEGLPPGKYVVEAVHEKLGSKETVVDVGAKGDVATDFSFGP